jgi:all-trans-retinol dehydrogenase (NAD+)
MIKKNHGHIITTASTAGFVGIYRLVDYCTSKHSVVGFHEALTNELRHMGVNGIKTTLVCPNYTNTGMCDGVTT